MNAVERVGAEGVAFGLARLRIRAFSCFIATGREDPCNLKYNPQLYGGDACQFFQIYMLKIAFKRTHCRRSCLCHPFATVV